ncbi:MAG: hypothetical protein IT366_10860 [Candidatus Hydrogenedentes bacterium]|nr:hypothetical protein [Candidatus Hydrogenedentota bacterium]
MITVECPKCHLMLKIPDQYAGSEGACKSCGTLITVPQLTATCATQPSNDSPPKSVPAKGKKVLALYAATMTVLTGTLGVFLVYQFKYEKHTENVTAQPEVAKAAPQSKPQAIEAANIQTPPTAPVTPTSPELFEGEVYQVSKPTKYQWRDPSTRRFSSSGATVLPVNGYFTMAAKDGPYYLVSITDGVNTFECRMTAKDLEDQELKHIDSNTLAAMRKQQEDAARKEYERLAAAERKRQLDEANAIAMQNAARAKEEQAYAEAEAAQAQQEQAEAEAEALRAQAYSAQMQAQSAQAQAYAAQAQAQTMSQAQSEQSYLNRQQETLNEQQYRINRQKLQR